MRRSAHVYWESFDDGAVLLDERTGALHTLNRTAGMLWQCLDGTAALSDVAADFAAVYRPSLGCGRRRGSGRAITLHAGPSRTPRPERRLANAARSWPDLRRP